MASLKMEKNAQPWGEEAPQRGGRELEGGGPGVTTGPLGVDEGPGGHRRREPAGASEAHRPLSAHTPVQLLWNGGHWPRSQEYWFLLVLVAAG